MQLQKEPVGFGYLLEEYQGVATGLIWGKLILLFAQFDFSNII